MIDTTITIKDGARTITYSDVIKVRTSHDNKYLIIFSADDKLYVHEMKDVVNMEYSSYDPVIRVGFL